MCRNAMKQIIIEPSLNQASISSLEYSGINQNINMISVQMGISINLKKIL
jgi:hypothetical protein